MSRSFAHVALIASVLALAIGPLARPGAAKKKAGDAPTTDAAKADSPTDNLTERGRRRLKLGARIRAVDSLGLRSQPNANAREVARVESGMLFRILEIREGWYRVATMPAPTAGVPESRGWIERDRVFGNVVDRGAAARP